ncbi:hypothetical protein RSK20926_02182 [Roseobacter sp. SK209-2-6]|nr:hypothetical protein RSK20926_02182 [Roseobacter sp. SK209-2-6]
MILKKLAGCNMGERWFPEPISAPQKPAAGALQTWFA